MISELFTLPQSMKVPAIGFGTYNAKGGDNLQMIKDAIEAGYRYFDTASLYGTERALGQAIKESGLPRELFFLASKAWTDEMGYEETKAACERSLNRLQTDYLDLYLIHWPKVNEEDTDWKERCQETWRAMEELVREGKVRAIGLSNFLPHHLDAILETATIKPAVNQLELHIGYSQEAAVAYTQSKGILVQAWSPLARGAMDNHPVISELARKYGKSKAQICLRFLYQKGIMPIVKSADKGRMLENMMIFDFELERADVQMLECMPQNTWQGEHPDFAIPKVKSNFNQ
ncbi:MAG: aldo/keto reductase [Lachnospiraceae bacterium]|nr:aldo/keto reductase [Lachnospiraceae bacterium]